MDEPEPIIFGAQIAFRNIATWSIVCQGRRYSGLSTKPMPTVYCPIVDTTTIASDSLLRNTIHEFIGRYGVIDMEALLSGMERIGASISYPVAQINCTCTPDQNREEGACPACRATLRQLQGSEIPC